MEAILYVNDCEDKKVYIAVGILILLIFSLFFINIKIKVHFCFAQSELSFEFRVAGIKIKLKKSEKKVNLHYNTAKYIAEHIKVKYFRLYILLGLDDPMADVFAVQLLRNTFAAIYCKFKSAFDKHTKLFVNIMPAFNQLTLNANFDCIIKVRTGYIIMAYIRHYINIIINKIRRLFS